MSFRTPRRRRTGGPTPTPVPQRTREDDTEVQMLLDVRSGLSRSPRVLGSGVRSGETRHSTPTGVSPTVVHNPGVGRPPSGLRRLFRESRLLKVDTYSAGGSRQGRPGLRDRLLHLKKVRPRAVPPSPRRLIGSTTAPSPSTDLGSVDFDRVL